MITVSHVYKQFEDGRVALNDVCATFDQGKTNLVIGQSGSGKTVLLKCIVGLHEVTSGDILFNDVVFNRLNFREKKSIRQKMGMLFQGSALFDSLTVEENVMFPLEMFTQMTRSERRDRANVCLNRVNIVNANHLYPAELSGGMQKRVAIARAIALQPHYLFCDEPNSGLDPRTSVVIDTLIQEITHEFNITTIVNTHDMNSVMGIGDKVIFIHQGNKWWEGTSADILHSDNEELNQFVFSTELTKKIRP
ncbi:MAG: ATP-binding cassette domain-containing protein [Bacteroidales bacterium]|nr:ATP-binding cassette domain-containing protein [Bacteroidales bacterium]